MKRFTKYLFSACFSILLFLPLSGQESAYAPGELIVQLEKGTEAELLVKRLQSFQGVSTSLASARLLSPPLGIWLWKFDPSGFRDKDFLDYVRQQPEVVLAQFNHFITERNTVPDDPQFSAQWQWLNTGSGGGVADADVDADEAWDITTGGLTATGEEIVVAVVESGIHVGHPDLAANLWHNPHEIPDNGVDDDDNGYLDDYDGWNIGQDNDNIPGGNHGTTVSGMIGAVGNNGLGVTGINWSVKIMPVAMQGVFESNVVEAYTYPYIQRKRFNETGGAEGAFVVAINSSWGIDFGQPSEAPIWCAFYDSLGVQGILSCGATANNNVNIDEVGDLPTACPSEYLVSVTASNSSDIRTFSAFGLNHVDLAAPGALIFSTSGLDAYISANGTSFASPLTAGVIALMYSAPCSNIAGQAIAYPAETALMVRDALFEGVDVKANLVPEVKTGGRVNAFRSLQLLLEVCGPCPAANNLSADNLTDVSASLSWSGALEATNYLIRYRMQGAPEWDTIFNAANPYVLTGLSGCETYEWQVYTTCPDTTSGFSDSYFFTTEGCCVAPDEITVTDITDESVLVQWNSVFAALNYGLTFQPIDSSAGPQSIGISGNSMLLEGLQPCKGYWMAMVSDCTGGGVSDPSEVVVFYTLCPCEPPENADTSQVEIQSAWFGWDSAENAQEYVVRYKELTEANWSLVEVTGTGIQLENLISCKNYRVQVKTICPIAESSYTDAVLFKTDCPPSSGNEPEILSTQMQVHPNPFHDRIRLEVTIAQTANAMVQVFDPLGRQVLQQDFGTLQKGRYLFDLPFGTPAKGVYWLRMQIDEAVFMEKMIAQ